MIINLFSFTVLCFTTVELKKNFSFLTKLLILKNVVKKRDHVTTKNRIKY
jgi:hypothetical protein